MASEENAVQKACLEYLRQVKGWLAWRSNQAPVPLKGGGYRRFVGLKGVSDILALAPVTVDVVGKGPWVFGVLVAVEAKGPKGTLRKEQKTFQQAVEAAGGVYIVARSVGDLIDGLAREGL